VGLSDKNAMQWIFLNHRPICCPLILKLIKVAFKEGRSNLPSESNVRDLYDKDMFILFFLTFSQKEFTFINENGKTYIMFYDTQKILSAIKNCVFKCLAAEARVSSVTPYLRKTQLYKHIYLKSEKSVLNNNINGRTPSMIRNKVVTIGFKRRKITSTIISNCFNKQHNRSDNIEATSYYIDKRNSVLNSIRCRINVASVKRTNLCEDKAVKKMKNSVDKAQANLIDFNITDDSAKSDKAYNCRNDNNNDFANVISPLSEWSNWTYHTNNVKRDPARNSYEVFSKNDVRLRQFFERNNQFDFLPRKLHGLLLHRHVKLTNVKCFNSPNDTIPCK